MSALSGWKALDAWIAESETKQFTACGAAIDLNVETHVVSGWIQEYQRIQIQRGRTAHIIHRTGRTNGAVWHVGKATDDLREVGSQFLSDVRNRVDRAITPLINEILARNPRAQKEAMRIAMDIGEAIGRLAGLAAEQNGEVVSA